MLRSHHACVRLRRMLELASDIKICIELLHRRLQRNHTRFHAETRPHQHPFGVFMMRLENFLLIGRRRNAF